MTKNEIYLDILSSSLPYLRNIATHSLFRRIKERSVYYETELIHFTVSWLKMKLIVVIFIF